MTKKRRKEILYRKWKNYVLNTSFSCQECGGKILYFCKYDANFCPQCNNWTEKKCTDPNCEFCKDRPETLELALSICKISIDHEQVNRNLSKERFIRHYSANERYKLRQEKLSKHYRNNGCI